MDAIETMKLAARIRQRREALKMTQSELADLIDKDYKSISRYEIGERVPSAVVLGELALTLGVTSDWLLGISDKMMPDGITREEQELISQFRMQSKGVRARVFELLRVLDGLE